MSFYRRIPDIAETPCIKEYLKFSTFEKCILVNNFSEADISDLDALIDSDAITKKVLDTEKVEFVDLWFAEPVGLEAAVIAKYLHLFWMQFGALPLVATFREGLNRKLFEDISHIRISRCHACVCGTCPCFTSNYTLMDCGDLVNLDCLTQNIMDFGYDIENCRKLLDRWSICPDLSPYLIETYVMRFLSSGSLVEITDSPYLLIKDFIFYTTQIIDVSSREYRVYPNICGCNECPDDYPMHWKHHNGVAHISRVPFGDSEIVCSMTLSKCPVVKELHFPWLKHFFTNVDIGDCEYLPEWTVVPTCALRALKAELGMSEEDYRMLIKGDTRKNYFNEIYGKRNMMFFIKAHNKLSENIQIRWHTYKDQPSLNRALRFVSEHKEVYEDTGFEDLSKRDLVEKILDLEDVVDENIVVDIDVKDVNYFMHYQQSPIEARPIDIREVKEVPFEKIEEEYRKFAVCDLLAKKKRAEVDWIKTYWKIRDLGLRREYTDFRMPKDNTEDVLYDIEMTIYSNSVNDIARIPFKFDHSTFRAPCGAKVGEICKHFTQSDIIKKYIEQDAKEGQKYRRELERVNKANGIVAEKDYQYSQEVKRFKMPSAIARAVSDERKRKPNTVDMKQIKNLLMNKNLIKDQNSNSIASTLDWIATKIVKKLRDEVNDYFKFQSYPYILKKNLTFERIGSCYGRGFDSTHHHQVLCDHLRKYLLEKSTEQVLADCLEEEEKRIVSKNYAEKVLTEMKRRIMKSIKNRYSRSVIASLSLENLYTALYLTRHNKFREAREETGLRSVDLKRILNGGNANWR